jgi:hypothetical protein
MAVVAGVPGPLNNKNPGRVLFQGRGAVIWEE